MKKILTVSIILLFIGVAVAPSINQSVVKASTEDDLVEVTTQACGIQGYSDTTVKLTREQYQNLEEYLVEFRVRLNQTSTREEAIPIFKEAVLELDKYELLPRGMSVERAQKLIIDGYQNKVLIKLIERIYLNKQKISSIGFNIFCLIVGGGNNIRFVGVPFIPIRVLNMIILGYTRFAWPYTDRYYTNGELLSVGLLGRKYVSGSLHGEIFDIKIPRLDGWYYYHVGVIGFTGISIGLFGDYFYFGSAVFSWTS